jgi:hypothetical protein
MASVLIGLLIILCIAVIAANELFKFTDADAEIDEESLGDWPDLSSFKSFGGVHARRNDR